MMPKLNPILLAAFALLASSAFAAAPSVTITAPADGARLDAMAQTKLVYAVEPGPNGNHTHLYVDGKEVAILRKFKGTYTLETMPPGNHEICIKVVSKGHTPIGVEKCIKVTVQ